MTPSQTEQRAEEVVAEAPCLRSVLGQRCKAWLHPACAVAALHSAGLLRTPGTVEIEEAWLIENTDYVP